MTSLFFWGGGCYTEQRFRGTFTQTFSALKMVASGFSIELVSTKQHSVTFPKAITLSNKFVTVAREFHQGYTNLWRLNFVQWHLLFAA
jgi:hypothetical protein